MKAFRELATHADQYIADLFQSGEPVPGVIDDYSKHGPHGNPPMICASLYRLFFIKKNLFRYYAEKIRLLNTTNLRGDYLMKMVIDRK